MTDDQKTNTVVVPMHATPLENAVAAYINAKERFDECASAMHAAERDYHETHRALTASCNARALIFGDYVVVKADGGYDVIKPMHPHEVDSQYGVPL